MVIVNKKIIESVDDYDNWQFDNVQFSLTSKLKKD